MTKLVVGFIAGMLLFVIPLFVKNVRQYFLGLAASVYVFSQGWIFYHYNGIWYGDIPIIGLLVLGFLSQRQFRWSANPIGVPMLCLIVWGVIASFSAVNQGWALSELTNYARGYLLMICVVHHIQSLKDLRIVVYCMLGAFLVEIFIGLWQFKYGTTGLWFLGERRFGRISWRTMGTFFVPSFYANYLGMVLPLAFRMFVYYKPPNIRWTYFFGAAFLLGIVALYSTYGRAPWIGFVIAMAVLIIISVFQSRFKPRAKWTGAVMVLFVAVFILRYGTNIEGQFGGQRQGSVDIRWSQFDVARRIMQDNIVFGVGLGCYELASWNYMTREEQTDDMSVMYGQLVHNSYYLLASEMGILGGVFLIAWLGMICLTAIQILRIKPYHPFITNITLGIFGGIIVIGAVFTFSPDVHAYQLLYQICLFSGILLAAKRVLKEAAFNKARMDMKKRKLQSMNRSPSVSPQRESISD